MTLGKNFNVTERVKTEFQAEFGNLFNHPQFIPGFTNRVDDAITSQTSKYTSPAASNYANPASGTFNQAAKVFGSNSRIITLVLKLDF